MSDTMEQTGTETEAEAEDQAQHDMAHDTGAAGDETATTGTEAGTGATGPKRGRGAGVTYAGTEGGFALEALDELPDDIEGGRSRIYFNVLTAVAGNQAGLGKWHPVARFSTPTGAQTVAAQLTKQVEGKVLDKTLSDMTAADRKTAHGDKYVGWLTEDQAREIPEWDGWKWEFDSRKVNPETMEGRNVGDRDSILYAKLVTVEGSTEAATA